MAALRSGIGVVVVGSRGSGRSHFIRDLIGSLQPDLRSRLWLGHDLAHPHDAQPARLPEAVLTGRALLLVSALGRRPLPEPLRRLQREDALLIVEMGPLTARELLAVAEGRLGGPLDPATVPTFIPARGGEHIAALTEALAAATLSGALTWTGDRWALTAPTERSETLRSMVFTRTGDDIRSEFADAETILDVLGLAPALGLRATTQVLDLLGASLSAVETQLERLEEAGVIAVETGAAGLQLRIRDGIDELLILRTVSRLRRRRLAASIVDVLAARSAVELTARELIALAQHSLDLGHPVAPETLTRAARASLRTPDAALSLRIAASATEAGGGFDAEMAMAAAESQIGLPDAALARLSRMVDGAADDVQRTQALQALVRLVRQSAIQADEIIDSEVFGRLGLNDAKQDALKGFMLFTLGEPIAAGELITPAIPHLSGLDRAEALFHVGSVNFVLGHIARAAEALDEAEAAYLEAGSDASHVHMARANVDMLRGRIPDSLATVKGFRDAAASFGQPVAQGVLGWSIGNLLVLSGDLVEAVAELRASIRILEGAGLKRTLAMVQMDLAQALALVGDVEGATGAMPWSSDDDHGGGLAMTGKVLQVEGWIHASAGRRSEARRSLIRSAEAHAAGGFLLPSMAALVDAARFGGANDLIGRIEELAKEMDGECVVVALRYARALAALDSLGAPESGGSPSLAAEFDEIGVVTTEIGQLIVAAEAFDHAATLHRAAGADRDAAASTRLRDNRMAQCGLRRLPLMAPNPSSALSERELELADLAVAGLSNREIAGRLVLSVRTVETHLQRVYRKLGVRGRSELDEALRSR